jgi:hypothetical protein
MPQKFLGFTILDTISLRIEDAIRDGGDLRHLRNIVDAHDMRTAQNAGCDGRGRREKSLFRRQRLVCA